MKKLANIKLPEQPERFVKSYNRMLLPRKPKQHKIILHFVETGFPRIAECKINYPLRSRAEKIIRF